MSTVKKKIQELEKQIKHTPTEGRRSELKNLIEQLKSRDLQTPMSTRNFADIDLFNQVNGPVKKGLSFVFHVWSRVPGSFTRAGFL